jgi:hypothetical protein
MKGQFFFYAAQIANLFQIAVKLIFRTLYQAVTKSEFWRGNDLATVLSAGSCAVPYMPKTL